MAKSKVLKNDENVGFELVALYGGVLACDLVHLSSCDK